MPSNEAANRPEDTETAADAGEVEDDKHDRDPERAGSIETDEVSAGVVESERHPHTPMTRQRGDAGSASRQRYADPRSSDYSHDFQEDGSGSHPVKQPSSSRTDEKGIPDIARTRRPED